MRARDPVEVVRRLGGAAPLGEILASTTRHRLWRAVVDGRLLRASHGVYVLPELPAPELAAVRARGVLSHATAAAWWGLALVTPPEAVHVTVPRGARPPRQQGVRLHWSRHPQGEHSVTSVLRTVLDCAATMPLPEALAVADSALAQHFVQPAELLEAARAVRGPARGRVSRVAMAADRRAFNAFESCLRGLVLEAGLTGFEPQLEIRLPTRIVHVDLGDPQRRLVLEAESFEHHGGRDALRRDCERYNDLWANGWRVLRFAWEHVMFEQPWVKEILTETCRGGDRHLFVTSRRNAG
jgi:very-short-patch-repair endonuclease